MYGLIAIGLLPQPFNTFPEHKHNTWEIVYYTRGTGILKVNEHIYTFKPHDIFCLPPNVPHAEDSVEGYTNIHFCVNGFHKPPWPICSFHDTVEKDFYHVLIQLYREYHLKRNNWVNITESLLNTLYHYMISWDNKESTHPLVEKLENILVSNLSNASVSIKDIFETIPLSPDYLRKLFKKETGKNPNEYLNDLRIDYAKHLLQSIETNGFTIKEIAFRVGFSDPYYFSRVFKKSTGTTPSEWIPMN